MPDWVELIPTGPRIEGRDGRWFHFNLIADVIATFDREGAQLVIDYEHASEFDSVDGVPAAGWIVKLEARGGALWAQVEWTDRASAMITAREYRFLSPVFLYHAGTMEIRRLVSAGLTHRPNLDLVALNRRAPDPITETTTMKDTTRKALCKKLGLKEEASDEAIEEAVTNLQDEQVKAANAAQNPSLEKFVPRDDYDTVKTDLTAANARIAELETGDAEAAVDAAIESGKIAPANRDFYLKAAKNDRADFDRFVENAVAQDVTKRTDPKSQHSDGRKLSDDERAVCAQLGLDEKEFASSLAAAD